MQETGQQWSPAGSRTHKINNINEVWNMKKIIATVIFTASAIGLCSTSAFAADATKAQYKADVSKADADYKMAKKKCGPLSGNDKDVCQKEAKAAHESAVADAKVKRKDMDASKDAQKDKNAANYDVAKEKCDAMSGDAKDKCVAQAKSKYGK